MSLKVEQRSSSRVLPILVVLGHLDIFHVTRWVAIEVKWCILQRRVDGCTFEWLWCCCRIRVHRRRLLAALRRAVFISPDILLGSFLFVIVESNYMIDALLLILARVGRTTITFLAVARFRAMLARMKCYYRVLLLIESFTLATFLHSVR